MPDPDTAQDAEAKGALSTSKATEIFGLGIFCLLYIQPAGLLRLSGLGKFIKLF